MGGSFVIGFRLDDLFVSLIATFAVPGIDPHFFPSGIDRRAFGKAVVNPPMVGEFASRSLSQEILAVGW